MEAEARAEYTRQTGIAMTPVCVQHERYPWLRASLDGWNADRKIPLEVKCPGRKDHLVALGGRIPDKYFPQIQHILMVTGAKELHYFSYDGQNGMIVIVEADADYQQRLFEAELTFWNSVQSGIAPFFQAEMIPEKSSKGLESGSIQNSKIIEKKLLHAKTTAITKHTRSIADIPINAGFRPHHSSHEKCSWFEWLKRRLFS
jgi:predicted phage-related endonuclease